MYLCPDVLQDVARIANAAKWPVLLSSMSCNICLNWWNNDKSCEKSLNQEYIAAKLQISLPSYLSFCPHYSDKLSKMSCGFLESALKTQKPKLPQWNTHWFTHNEWQGHQWSCHWKDENCPKGPQTASTDPQSKNWAKTVEKSDRPPPGCRGAARLVVSELRPTRALLLVLLRLTGNHGADPLNRPILNQELLVLATLSGSFLLLGFVGNFGPTAYGWRCSRWPRGSVETMWTMRRQTPSAWIQPSGLAFGEKRERMWNRQNLRDQTSYKYSQ